MRDLLALDVVPAETSAVALAVVGVVAVVMIAPMLALCGSCDEREPDPGHFDRPGPAYQPPNQYPHPPQQQHAPYPPHRQQQHQYPSMQQSQGHPYPQSGSHYSGQQDYQSAHSGYPQSGGYPQSSGSHPHQAQHYHQQQQYVGHQSNQHGYQGQAGHYSAPHPSQPQHAQYPRPGPESRQSASGAPALPPSDTHLQPADVTLEAVEAVLFQVCDGMKGMIKPGKTLVRDTIRTGVSAVIADVTTNYAVDETMMLFPDKNKKSRQMRLYEQLNLKDSMPLVSVDTEIFSHEENGRKVTLPAAIFVNRVKTLADTLKGFKTIEEKQAELFGIWSQLAKVLKMFHQRGWYLRDVTYENVVHVRMGATEGWTLLEFGNASRPKSAISKNTIPPRQCPPELAEEMLMNNEEKVHLSTAGDMWMLGMLVYQVMTGEPYWKKSLKDAEILQIMADPRRPLPHKEKPVLNLVQLILESLMHRDPAKRLTSTDLIKRLEQDMATAGAKTINPGPVVDEQPIVLQGA